MQRMDFGPTCAECASHLLDVGDELVCPSCGVTEAKEVFEIGLTRRRNESAPGRQALGSYMGSLKMTGDERRTKGITGTSSNYEYLKTLSDFAGRKENAFSGCTHMIERVGEKLRLPRVVILEAVTIAKKVIKTGIPHRRPTLASVSAYSLIAACRMERITSVSIKEIIRAHGDLGKRVTSSSIIQLTLESPVKTFAGAPEEYVTRVLARLSLNQRLVRALADEEVNQTAFFNSLRETAKELLGLLREETKAGRRPSALAGSAVYSAERVLSLCESRQRRLTQRDVAECGDAAEYTIREQCARFFVHGVEIIVSRRKRSLPPAFEN